MEGIVVKSVPPGTLRDTYNRRVKFEYLHSLDTELWPQEMLQWERNALVERIDAVPEDVFAPIAHKFIA